MRLWHYQLLPYLPDAQLKGQLRELVAIMHDLRDKGGTNHVLVNRVMGYRRWDLWLYFVKYYSAYKQRFGKPISDKIYNEFCEFTNDFSVDPEPFKDWHTKLYLRMCMSNLAEKHVYGVGKSAITDEEWQRLKDGYKEITGEEYEL